MLIDGVEVGDRRRRGVGVGAFLLALLTAGALAHVAVRMKGIEVAYDLGKERRVNTELEEQRRRLHIEIGMLKDPSRVVGLARDKLRMGPPAAADIVRVADGARAGAAAAAPTQAQARKAPAGQERP
jgi:cell division protein FtsL